MWLPLALTWIFLTWVCVCLQVCESNQLVTFVLGYEQMYYMYLIIISSS